MMVGTFSVYALLYSHPKETTEGRSVRSSPPTVGPIRVRRPGVLTVGDHAIHQDSAKVRVETSLVQSQCQDNRRALRLTLR